MTGRTPTGAGPWPYALWALTRAWLLACVFKVVTVPGPDVTVDVSVIYRSWYEVLLTGTYPLDDVTWQYPPGAALAILSPPCCRSWSTRPRSSYWCWSATRWCWGCCCTRAMRPGIRAAGAWVWIAGVPLLGPTVYARYDLMVTAVAVAALLAGVQPAPCAGGAGGVRGAAEGVARAAAGRGAQGASDAGRVGVGGADGGGARGGFRAVDAGGVRVPGLPAGPGHRGRVAGGAGLPRGAAVRLGGAGGAALRLAGVPRPARGAGVDAGAGARRPGAGLAAAVAAAGPDVRRAHPGRGGVHGGAAVHGHQSGDQPAVRGVAGRARGGVPGVPGGGDDASGRAGAGGGGGDAAGVPGRLRPCGGERRVGRDAPSRTERAAGGGLTDRGAAAVAVDGAGGAGRGSRPGNGRSWRVRVSRAEWRGSRASRR